MRAGAAKDLIALAAIEEDPNVLLQLALTLGDSDDPRAPEALARLAAAHSDVRWIDAAVLSSIARFPGAFVNAISSKFPHMPPRMIEQAVVTALATGDESAIPAVIGLISNHPDPALRVRLLELAAEHGFADPAKLGAIVAGSFATASGDAERLAALRLISFADAATKDAAVAQVFATGQSPEYQELAVRAILAKPDAELAGRLIAQVPRSTPRLASGIVNALLSDDATALQYLESEAASASAVSQIQRFRLLNHGDDQLRAAAERLFARAAAPAELAAADFIAALKAEPDLAAGRELFTVHCAICHQFSGSGMAVGPSLDAEVGRPAESLLIDILQPGAEITASYATYLVKTGSGASHAGVIASESATSIEIVQAAAATTTLLRRDITSIERLGLSLMPATFGEVLAADGVANIIAYLKSRPERSGLVLFEDDLAFAQALADGRGSGRLDWSDAGSGRACLTVEGFQRHSKQVPGWSFPIREHPADGEFRFLRLMVKTRGAKGIMVELADDQRFPPDDQPVRTYYLGENSTGWQSNQLAAEVPQVWQDFTIDLWQGNRDFIMTGIALTVMGGKASFDRIELLRATD